MKVLLIMPDAHMHKLRLGSYVCSMREAPLTLTTLAALTPGHADIEQVLVDESVERVPLDFPADLVGISVITGCAPRAYELAEHFRARGIPVVLGGVHVTILPGEAARHADAIVIGRGETAWPQVVEDFRAGRLRRVYREEPVADEVLDGVPSPRRDLQRSWRYMVPNSLQATRGCKRVCDFCSVPAVWPRYLKRPVADVLADIARVRGRNLCFNDVSLVDDREHARELFTAMIPLGKRWGGLATIDVTRDAELLELMARSGCVYLLIGFESACQSTLQQIRKGFNHTVEYSEAVRALHSNGISVQGCFVFGFDHDDGTVFEATVDLVNELRIDIPRYSLYTPYPGTPLFARLLAEGRILSFNWSDYDTMHVVIRPALMTPEALYEGFKLAYRQTFRLPHILRRTARPSFTSLINLVGNLTYRVFVRRLYSEARFSEPYSTHAPGAPPAPDLFLEPGQGRPESRSVRSIRT
jgi:radical SAM superfamily enzyme YgiQ (UPF0313 family)